DLGHAVEFRLQPARERLYLEAGFRQNGRREPALLLEQRGEQMLHVNLLVSVTDRFTLRGADGFLEFFREPVEVHNLSLYLTTQYELAVCDDSHCPRVLVTPNNYQSWRCADARRFVDTPGPEDQTENRNTRKERGMGTQPAPYGRSTQRPPAVKEI